MEIETLEFKLQNMVEKMDKLSESIDKLNALENERLEKYAESNTKLCYLEKIIEGVKSDIKELEERVKNNSEKNLDKFRNWVSLIITIFLFLITFITLVLKGVNYDDTKNTQQIELNETVVDNNTDYNFWN